MATWTGYYITIENQWGSAPYDWDTDMDGGAATYELKVALVSGYTPAQTHDFWNDVSASEISAVNYTAGGNACANPAVSRSGATITFDADDPSSWAQNASGFSGTYRAILYADSGTASTSPVIAYSSEFTIDTTIVPLNVELSPTGIWVLVVS